MAEATPRRKNVILEETRIMFRNFAGEEKEFNRAGDRNFVVFLNEDVAESLAADGYNVKRLKPRPDDEPDVIPQAYLKVTVSYKNNAPRVVLVSKNGTAKTPLDEETVSAADQVIVKYADVIISPYHYEVNGRKGVSAYLKSIFIVLEEDELDQKYADLEDTSMNSPRSGVRFDGPDEGEY